MTTIVHKDSAKIYQFPAGGPAGLGRRFIGLQYPLTELGATQPVKIASGSGWYHEAALETETPRKR